MTVQALIFDVDGTLAETEEYHRQAFNQAFVEFGIKWEWDEALYAELLKIAGGKERIKYYSERVKSEIIDIPRLHERKNEIYAQRLRDKDISLRDGVCQLLYYAREKDIRLAIATTSSRENVCNLLNATLGPSSLSWFNVMCCGDDVSAKKPDPAIYQLALKHLHVPPAKCLVFEDSHAGLQSALRAELPVVITPSLFTQDDDFTGAALVLKDLTNIRTFLDRIA